MLLSIYSFFLSCHSKTEFRLTKFGPNKFHPNSYITLGYIGTRHKVVIVTRFVACFKLFRINSNLLLLFNGLYPWVFYSETAVTND